MKYFHFENFNTGLKLLALCVAVLLITAIPWLVVAFFLSATPGLGIVFLLLTAAAQIFLQGVLARKFWGWK